MGLPDIGEKDFVPIIESFEKQVDQLNKSQSAEQQEKIEQAISQRFQELAKKYSEKSLHTLQGLVINLIENEKVSAAVQEIFKSQKKSTTLSSLPNAHNNCYVNTLLWVLADNTSAFEPLLAIDHDLQKVVLSIKNNTSLATSTHKELRSALERIYRANGAYRGKGGSPIDLFEKSLGVPVLVAFDQSPRDCLKHTLENSGNRPDFFLVQAGAQYQREFTNSSVQLKDGTVYELKSLVQNRVQHTYNHWVMFSNERDHWSIYDDSPTRGHDADGFHLGVQKQAVKEPAATPGKFDELLFVFVKK